MVLAENSSHFPCDANTWIDVSYCIIIGFSQIHVNFSHILGHMEEIY